MEPRAPASVLRLAFAAALFAFPALLFTSFDKAPARALGAALTLGIIALAVHRRGNRLASASDVPAFAAILTFLAVSMLQALAWHAPFWMVVNYGRLLGVVIVALAIRRLQPSASALYVGCAIAATCAGLVALDQCFIDGLPRAEGLDPPFGEPLTNIFAGLAVVLGFVAVSAGRPARRSLAALAWIALAGGLVAAFLAGSRGAWVAAAVLAVWIFGRKRPWMGAALAVAFVVASFGVDMLAARWSAGYSDLVLYNNGNADTSLGSRIQLWHAALAAFASHPLVGIGPEGLRDFFLAREAQGQLSRYAVQFGHAHNEWLQALATGGLVQGLAMAAAFWFPWRRFRAATSRRDSPAARAGEAVVLGFFVLGLSDTFFIHRVALTVFVVVVTWLLAWTEQPGDRW